MLKVDFIEKSELKLLKFEVFWKWTWSLQEIKLKIEGVASQKTWLKREISAINIGG